MKVQNMSDEEYAHWRAREIRVLRRWGWCCWALNLFSLALALWANYRA